MIKFGFAGAIAGGLLVLALSGCAPAVPTAGPTTSASPTHSATPAPTKPALAELIVSPDGLGNLVVGRPVPAGPAATALMHYDPTQCVGESGLSAGDPGSGAWLPSYPDSESLHGNALPFDVGLVDAPTDPIRMIAIWATALKTDKGIGPGSTVAQLTSAYGSALSLDSAGDSDVYVLKGARSKLLFEVIPSAPDVDPERTDKVLWMHIVDLTDGDVHFDHGETGPCPE